MWFVLLKVYLYWGFSMLRKLIGLGLGLFATSGAWALGLGEINLDSALNEPLVARIPITVSSPDELRDLDARVALNETFARYGLDRPAFLNSLRFQVTRQGGQPTLLVTSTQPITEPFVTFLLEANWGRGRLLREYTVLLDPPVFNDQAVAAPVSVAQSVSAQPTITSGQIARAPQAPVPSPVPQPVYRQPAIVGQDYGPVQRNENLWTISKNSLPSGVSINQMMIAIYRANPEAFMGNINLLKEGSTLQIPSADSVRNLLREDANRVVVAHNSQWRGGRAASSSGNRVASSASSRTDSASSVSGAGTGESNQRLVLVAPDASSDGPGSAEATQRLAEAQQQLADERAENDALSGELQSLREELDEAKKLINLENSGLAELQQSLGEKDNDAAADGAGVEIEVPATIDGPDESSETETVAEATTDNTIDNTDPTALLNSAGTTTTTEPTVATTTPEATTKPTAVVTPAVEDKPSLISRILGFFGNPFFYIGIALLAGLATLGVMLRGRKSSESSEWDALDIDGSDVDLDSSLEELGQATVAGKSPEELAGADVEYFEDTGTFKPVDFDATEQTGQVAALGADEAPFADTMAGETGVKLDQADALSEADFHMAYGLYDQAADLVSKAVGKEPDRLDLQLKLQEIYFVWGAEDKFLEHAKKLKVTLADEHPGEWEKIAIMGKQICPGDDLFEGGTSSSPIMGDVVDLQLDGTGTADSIDFPAAEFSSEEFGNDAGAADANEDVIDLDLGDALFASDEAPTAAGADSNVLDFSIDGPDDLAASSDVEAVKERIETALSNSEGEDTEEMDLDELGIDLNFGEITSVSEGTSGEFAVYNEEAKDVSQDETAAADEDFDELFAGLTDDNEPSAIIDADLAPASLDDDHLGDKLLDTSELKVEMEDLLAADVNGLLAADETARGVENLDDEIAIDSSDSDSTGSFSAEIRSLSSDEIEIGEELAATSGGVDFDFNAGDDDETVLQETLVSMDEVNVSDVLNTDTDLDEVFAGSDEDTVLAKALGADGDTPEFAEVFGDPSQDTSSMPALTDLDEDDNLTGAVTFQGVFENPAEAEAPVDEFSEDIFPGEDGLTQELQAMDLDVGETVDDAGEGTTMRVATSNLALPDNADLTINEVSTKLDLARAYLDMGDPDGARGILEEVMQEGNEVQQGDARELLQSLS